MKLSQYARRQGISYRTALRWWKAGQIKGYQAPTGTIIIEDQTPERAKIVQRVAIYARVSSREHQLNLERQAERLQDYCAAKGYQIATVVKEIASGVNDARPKFLALLRDPTITTISWYTKIAPPALVSVIWRPSWNSKAEALRWSIWPRTTARIFLPT